MGSMPTEILLYEAITNDSAADFISEVDAAGNSDFSVRINSLGGNVFAGFGMFAKVAEATGTTTARVDGAAMSMAFALLPAFDRVEALDVSRFMIHRISTGNDEKLSEAEAAELADMNAQFREKMESRIDTGEFQRITGQSFASVFEAEGRPDILLSAAQAQKIGLVDRVVEMTRGQKKEDRRKRRAEMAMPYAAFWKGKEPEAEQKPTQKSISTNMTLDEFKAAHPAIYAQAVAEGVKQGTKNERVRTGSFLAFVEVAPEAVQKSIKEGEEFTTQHLAEFTVAMHSADTKKKLTASAEVKGTNTGEAQEPEVKTDGTPEPEANGQSKEVAEAEAGLRKALEAKGFFQGKAQTQKTA